MSDVRQQEHEEERQLRDLLERTFFALDAADGEAAAAALTDPAVVDLRPWDPGAGTPAPRSPEEIGAQWEAHLYAFDALEHHLGAPRFTGDGATALGLAHLRIELVAGRDRRTIYADLIGRFQREDGRWHIERLEFDVLREEGNPDVRH
ncbi:MAG: nuclear transport factor 2 family protein [Acidobacteriota bacterium]